MRRAAAPLLFFTALLSVNACAPAVPSGGDAALHTPYGPPARTGSPPADHTPTRPGPTDEEIRATDQPGPRRSGALVVAGDVSSAPRAAVAGPDESRACAPNAAVIGCVRVRYDSEQPTRLGLATGRREIGLAWVTGKGDHAVYVARFNADLHAMGQTTVTTAGDPYDVAISAVPNGEYLVAAATSKGLEINHLGANGLVNAPRRFVLENQAAFAPYLGARDGGGPLLVFTSGSTTWAALLDIAGVEQWRTAIFSSPTEPEIASVIWTGDGFLVSSRPNGVALMRVELDGSHGPALSQVGGTTEYPHLAWDGSRAQLTWFEFSDPMGMRWANVDKNGALSGPIVDIGAMPAYSSPAPPAFVGGKRVVVMGGRTGTTGTASRLDIVRLSKEGKPLAPTFNLLNRQPSRATCYRAAPLGDSLVVAWLEGVSQPGSPAREIGLARIAP